MIFIMILLFVLSIILESIVPNLLKGFIPLFVIAIILVSSTFRLKENAFYVVIFLSGLLYDFLYTNTIILNAFIFLFIGYLSKMIVGDKIGFFKLLFFYYLLSCLYFLIMFLFTYLYLPHNLINLLSKYINSIAINTFYFLMLYLLFIGVKQVISNRNKKHSYF